MILLLLQSYMWISFLYVSVYESLKEGGSKQLWCAESNCNIIFAFGWVECLQITSYNYFNSGAMILLLLQIKLLVN